MPRYPGWNEAPKKKVDKYCRCPDLQDGDAPGVPCPRCGKPIKLSSKYGNKRTEYNGAIYDSKREVQFAKDLHVRELAGEVRNIRRQVRIPLFAAGACDVCPIEDQWADPHRFGRNVPVKYGSGRQAVHVVDFVFEESQRPGTPNCKMDASGWLWRIRYVEVKGMDHPVGKLKRAMVEAMLGVKIEVAK